jgi:uncharacterized protein
VNPLTIRVDDIEESAQPWEADLDRELLDETLAGPPATEFKADGASHVRAELTKMGREVLVRGRFSVPLRGQCKRCLKPLSLGAPADFTLIFVPTDDPKLQHEAEQHRGHGKRHKDDESEGPSASFDLGGVDQETYHGKEIDLGPALREQVLLALPPSPLCTEECKGLCPTCGADLNERDCGHRPESTDPRWQALKDIQLDKKE